MRSGIHGTSPYLWNGLNKALSLFLGSIFLAGAVVGFLVGRWLW